MLLDHLAEELTAEMHLGGPAQVLGGLVKVGVRRGLGSWTG